jgi:hypothetical protein
MNLASLIFDSKIYSDLQQEGSIWKCILFPDLIFLFSQKPLLLSCLQASR